MYKHNMILILLGSIFIFMACPVTNTDKESISNTNAPFSKDYGVKKTTEIEVNSTLQARWSGYSFLQEIAISNSCSLPPFTTISDCLEKILVADINKDNYLDIFLGVDTTVNQSGYLSHQPNYYIYFNQKDGKMSFAYKLARSNIPNEQITDIADIFNQQENYPLDLLGADFGGKSIVWSATSSNTLSYASPISFSIPRHGGDAFAYDYNGDGINDLLSIGSGSAAPALLYLYEGTSTGAYLPDPITLYSGDYQGSTSYHEHFLFIGDINNDGFIDFGLSGLGKFYVLKSNGIYKYDGIENALVFREEVIAIFKENDSGKFKVANITGRRYREYEIYSNGTTSDRLTDYTLEGMDRALIDDINHDGLMDIVYVLNGTDDLKYAIQTPAGFTTAKIADTGRVLQPVVENSYTQIATADFNNDGLKDIAIVLRGNTDATTESYLQIYLSK